MIEALLILMCGTAELSSAVTAAATQFAVDPVLIVTVMHAESTCKPNAVSSAGAKGLMQVMPVWNVKLKSIGVTNLSDPKQNIKAGAYILKLCGAGDTSYNSYNALRCYGGSEHYASRLYPIYKLNKVNRNDQ